MTRITCDHTDWCLLAHAHDHRSESLVQGQLLIQAIDRSTPGSTPFLNGQPKSRHCELLASSSPGSKGGLGVHPPSTRSCTRPADTSPPRPRRRARGASRRKCSGSRRSRWSSSTRSRSKRTSWSGITSSRVPKARRRRCAWRAKAMSACRSRPVRRRTWPRVHACTCRQSLRGRVLPRQAGLPARVPLSAAKCVAARRLVSQSQSARRGRRHSHVRQGARSFRRALPPASLALRWQDDTQRPL